MNKNTILSIVSVLFVIILSNLASAYIIRDVQAAREAEWERYEQYKTDYVQFNDLGGYEQYLSERNLQREFGFKPASYYYVPPSVLNAYYNPPLQGDAYYTENRGYTSSLYQPSAVKYYGVNTNGRTTGYISSTLGGKYFDHPQINGAQGYLTVNYPSYSGYSSYGYNYDYGYNYGYNSGYGYDYNNYGYDSYNYYNAYDAETEEPVFYARIAEPLSNGFYVVGFY